MNLTYTYEIAGSVNGQLLAGEGNGNFNPADGKSKLTVTFGRLPTAWDPRSIVLMCCSRPFAMAAMQNAGAQNLLSLSGGEITIGRHLSGVTRRAVLRDRSNKILVNISASSRTLLFPTEPGHDESRIEEGTCSLPELLFRSTKSRHRAGAKSTAALIVNPKDNRCSIAKPLTNPTEPSSQNWESDAHEKRLFALSSNALKSRSSPPALEVMDYVSPRESKRAQEPPQLLVMEPTVSAKRQERKKLWSFYK